MPYRHIDDRTSVDPLTGERITPAEFMSRQEERGFAPVPSKINEEWEAREPAIPLNRPAAHIIKDIEPYKSLETGEVIGSRSHHRQHLRQHGLIEVGNEKFPPRQAPRMPDPRPEIARAMQNRGRNYQGE